MIMLQSIFAADTFLTYNTTISSAEKAQIGEALTPVLKLIGVLQYVAGIVIILSLIYTGFIYFKGDEGSKHQAIQRLGGILIGAILIFAASTIAKIIFG